MSEEYSDEEENQWSGTNSNSSKNELSIDSVLDVCQKLKNYAGDLGLPILDSPHAGSALYNLLLWKMGYQ